MSPFALLYFFGLKIQSFLYYTKILKVVNFRTLILSVGNLTVGGTGKTPMVMLLADRLKKKYPNIAILSRGYKRNTSGFEVVHDGKKILTDSESAGDEAFLTASVLNNCVVCVDENRKRGILEIESRFKPDLIILDDGFQQKGIKKDCDIILLNASRPFHEFSLLPMGLGRETIKSLYSASMIVLTKTNQQADPKWMGKIPPINYYTAVFKPTIWEFSKSEYRQIKKITQDVFAFCGIGDPDSFKNNLKKMHIPVKKFHIFNDHEKYRLHTIKALEDKITNSTCKAVITTEKDLVKLPDSFLEKFHIFALRVNHVLNNERVYLDDILSWLNK